MINLEDKWTYADLNTSGWSNPAYDTKEEAIQQAKKEFKNNGCIVIGQLKKFIDSYHPENQEYVVYD